MSQQHLRLLTSNTSARFESFWPGPNVSVVAALRAFSLNDEDGQHLLIGPAASGKSHLAQACCRARWDRDRQASYLDLAEVGLDGSVPVEMAVSGLLVIDGLQTLQPGDELKLLRLIDRVRLEESKLLLCSRMWPEQLEIRTPDLRSRLQWGAILELRSMAEPALREMLGHRARLLGVHLSPRVQDYLLRRIPRDPGALVRTLEQAVDKAVGAGRQITVPLLREVLGGTVGA